MPNWELKIRYSVEHNLVSINQQLRRRANARNVSFRISLRCEVHIINPVDKTKLCIGYLMAGTLVLPNMVNQGFFSFFMATGFRQREVC